MIYTAIAPCGGAAATPISTRSIMALPGKDRSTA